MSEPKTSVPGKTAFAVRSAFIITAILMATGCALQPGSSSENGNGAATGRYQFGYVVSSPSDIQAQVFSGESHTYLALPAGVQLRVVTGSDGLRSPARKGPYWVVNGLATHWRFATTKGVVDATATGAARQMALVSGAQATIAKTMSTATTTTPAVPAAKNTMQKVSVPVAKVTPVAMPVALSSEKTPSVKTTSHHSEVYFIPGAEGRIMPLQQALIHIIPADWQTHISKYISPSIPVTWHKGLWTTSLNTMAKSDAWVDHVDFENKTVRINPTSALLIGIPGLSPNKTSATSSGNATATYSKVASKTTGHAKGTILPNTFSMSAKSSMTIGKTMSPPVAAPSLIGAIPVFILNKSDLILTDLQKWAKQSGWTVVWQVPEDWQVPNTTTFRGDFQKSVSQVIQALSANGANVHAVFHTANNTVVISGAGGGE